MSKATGNPYPQTIEPSLGKHPRDETPEETPKVNEGRSRKRANNKPATRSIESTEKERLANRFADLIAASQACNDMLRVAGDIELLSSHQGQSLRSVEWANQAGFIVLGAEVSGTIFKMLGGIVPGIMVKDGGKIRMALDEFQLNHLWKHIQAHTFSQMQLLPQEAQHLVNQENFDQIPQNDQGHHYLLCVETVPQGFTKFIVMQQAAIKDIMHLRRNIEVRNDVARDVAFTTRALLSFPNRRYLFPPEARMLAPQAQPPTTHNQQSGNSYGLQRQDTPSVYHNRPIHVQNSTQGQHLHAHAQSMVNPSLRFQNHSITQAGPSQAYSIQEIMQAGPPQSYPVQGMMQAGPSQSFSVPGMTQDSRIPAHAQRIPQYAHGATQMRNRYPPSGLATAGSMHQMGAQPTSGTTTTTTTSRPLSTTPVQIRVPPPPPMHYPVNSAPQSSRSISSSSGYNQTLPAPPVLVPGHMQTPQTWVEGANGTEHQQPRTRYTPNPARSQAHTPLPTVQTEQAPNGYGQQELGSVRQEPPVQSFEAGQVAVQEGVTPSYLTTDEAQLDGAQLDATGFDYGFDFDAFYSTSINDNAVAGSSTGVGTIEGADPGAYTVNLWNNN